MRKLIPFFLLALLGLIMVTACQASSNESVATVTPVSSETASSFPAAAPTVTPTATPEPTVEPTPIATPFSVYAPTVNMSFEELVGDDGYYELPIGFPESDTYRIVVDIYYQVVMVYTTDENGEYTVPVRYMLCSTGLNNATPIGTFNMDNYRVRFGRFANDGRCGQYWTQIRKRIYFHTILYSEKDASTYLVDTYNKLGEPDSHGCVRLTVPDARWIYYNIAQDTEIEIRKGSASDMETAEIRAQLVLADAPEEQVDLEKGDIPDTDNWSIADVPNEVKFVQGSQSD